MDLITSFERLESWQLGYLAGIVDGEGSIGLYKQGHHFHCTIRITATNKQFTEMLVTTTNLGSAYGCDRPNPKHKRQEIWVIQNRGECLLFLKKLLPMLLLKKKQAALAIEYCEGSLMQTITETRCDEIRAALNALNMRGL